MKLTNKHGLPDTFFHAIRNDKYHSGGADYTATQLINPVRVTLLRKRHEDEIEEDVTDNVWSMLGKAVHAVLAAAQQDNVLQEERLYCRIADRNISGTTDLYRESGVIEDYKVTSVWTRIYESRFREWEEQLNIYGWLLRENNFPVTELRVVCIYRDWTPAMTSRDARAPQQQAEVVQLPLWSFESVRSFVRERVTALKGAENLPDEELPFCSPDQMWEKPTRYAVMRAGRQRAVRVLDSHEAAERVRRNETTRTSIAHEVVKRAGERTRCERYCSVAPFCSQYHAYQDGAHGAK